MKLEDLLFRVRPQVLGCPEPVAINALRSAAEELCRETHVWQKKLDPVSVYSGIGDYGLPTPAYSRIVSPLRIQFDGKDVTHKHEGELDLWDETWRDKVDTTPSFWTMESPETLRLVPKPNADRTDVLIAWASLEPAEDEVTLPGWFHQYSRCLKDGALAEIKEIPNKPWSDPKMAQFHRRRFNVEVSKARYDVSRGFTDRPIRTTAYPR